MEEGGRQRLPFQGYRSDMMFPDSENAFIIWTGTARMWVIAPERRAFHAAHIQVGQQAFFVEGARRVAGCEVIEVLALADL